MVITRKMTASEELGIKICEVLGVDHNCVQRVMVEIVAGSVIPYVEVTMIDFDNKLCSINWDNLKQVTLEQEE